MPTVSNLIVTEGGKKGEVYSILNFPFKIGRMSNNDIVFEDKRVSRYHAEIRMKNDAYIIRDLGSHNGIQRVKGKTMDLCVYEVLL